jgi:hypothetical protein
MYPTSQIHNNSRGLRGGNIFGIGFYQKVESHESRRRVFFFFLTSLRTSGFLGSKEVKSYTMPWMLIQQSAIVQWVPTSAAVYHLQHTKNERD